jgi:eukaryotic-like serine/threonine-protein kinase
VTPLDGSSQPRPVLRTAAYEGGGRFSPDGRWMTYVSDESGQAQIYLRPLQGPQRKWQVSTEGGAQPVWSRSGAQLFYRDGDKLMVVDVATGSEPGLSQPRLLFEKHYSFGNNISIANYDIAPDDERFLMIKEAAGAGHLNIVLNWFEELKARVPTK